MARQLTPFGRILLVLCGLALIGYGLYKYGVLEKLIPAAKERASVVPGKAELPEVREASSEFPGTASPVPMPGTSPGCTDHPEVRTLIWAWNAQMGMMFANGGAQSTTGGLIRQDGVSKMQEDLVTFANELKGGNPQPSKGAHFVSIMGDGSATFLKAVND